MILPMWYMLSTFQFITSLLDEHSGNRRHEDKGTSEQDYPPKPGSGTISLRVLPVLVDLLLRWARDAFLYRNRVVRRTGEIVPGSSLVIDGARPVSREKVITVALHTTSLVPQVVGAGGTAGNKPEEDKGRQSEE